MPETPPPNSHVRSPRASIILTVIGALWFVAAWIAFGRAHVPEPIVRGPGVTSVHMLSRHHPPLEGTAGDTEVFVFDSGTEGACVLVLCGTHPNEPASVVTAAVLAENAQAQAGRLILVPRANASGFTHGDPQEAYLQRFAIELPDGSLRWFRHGSRMTNPVHQWPDPTLHVNPAGQMLAGPDSRNLNRCYPGRPAGMLTEQVAWAITQMIREENVDLVVDVHEASPEYPTVNVMVFHENAEELAAVTKLMLEDAIPGFEISAEPSPVNLRGLSHRELGDNTQAQVILLESANPSQGRLKGRTDTDQLILGRDAAYLTALAMQERFRSGDSRESNRRLVWAPPYGEGEDAYPIEHRVARHLAVIDQLMLWLECERGPAVVTGIPTYEEFVERGVGAFLQPVGDG